MDYAESIYLFKVNNINRRKNKRIMFKVHNKDTSTTSMTRLIILTSYKFSCSVLKINATFTMSLQLQFS